MEVWRVLLNICKYHVIDVLTIVNSRCSLDTSILYHGDIVHIPDELLELGVTAYFNEGAGTFKLWVSAS